MSEPKIPIPTALLSPEAQAYTNQLISEAIKGVFAQLGPVLESIAMTPEKIAAAEAIRRAPTEKEIAAQLREQRERRMTQQEAEENRANILRNQSACPHRYPTGQTSIGVVRNFPDRQPRGICMLCQVLLTPRQWQILAPDADNPRGVPKIVDAHPQYNLVLEALAAKG